MNKAEIVEEVAGKVGLTKKDANNAVNAITSAITDSLTGEERVTLVGFGTFEVRKRKARRGVNPQTRQAITNSAQKDAACFHDALSNWNCLLQVIPQPVEFYNNLLRQD